MIIINLKKSLTKMQQICRWKFLWQRKRQRRSSTSSIWPAKEIMIRATLDIQYCIHKKSWHEWDLISYVYATCHVTCINMSIAFHICESHNVIMWSRKMPQRCNTGQFLKRKGILPVANKKKIKGHERYVSEFMV